MDIKKKMKGINKNPTREYKIATAIISFLLIVFLTSKMWLPDVEKKQSTPVGYIGEISTTTKLNLMSWEYNPISNFMEVTVSVSDDRNFNRTEFVASSKVSKSKSLETEIIIKENSMMIIHIKKVPKNFEQVSLWIEKIKDEKSKEKSNKVNFKCDYRDVKINTDLQAKSKKEYVLKSIEVEIENVKKKISEISEAISDKQNKISVHKSDIQTLEKEMKYQTQAEIKNTNSIIDNKIKDIEFLEKQIENDNKNISSLNAKLSKLNLKLSDTKN